MEFPDIV